MVKTMKRSNRKFDFRTAFIDVLLNVLTSMIFIFVLTTLVMQLKKVTDEGPLRKAEYIASITWDDNVDCDVDLWIRDPDGVLVSYTNKNQNMMNLERDDLGFVNDFFTISQDVLSNLVAGKPVPPMPGKDQFNEETLVFRGIMRGDYVMNVHLYSCRVIRNNMVIPVKPKQPFALKIHLKIMKINPYKVVFTKDVEFSYVWEELNLTQFTVDESKNIVLFEDTPVKLIKPKDVFQ